MNKKFLILTVIGLPQLLFYVTNLEVTAGIVLTLFIAYKLSIYRGNLTKTFNMEKELITDKKSSFHEFTASFLLIISGFINFGDLSMFVTQDALENLVIFILMYFVIFILLSYLAYRFVFKGITNKDSGGKKC